MKSKSKKHVGKDKEKTERSRSESSGTLKMEPAEVIAFLKGEVNRLLLQFFYSKPTISVADNQAIRALE